jgi:hypothetical protein
MKSFNTFVNEILEAAELDEANGNAHQRRKDLGKYDPNAGSRKKEGRPEEQKKRSKVPGNNYANVNTSEEVENAQEAVSDFKPSTDSSGIPPWAQKTKADLAAKEKAKGPAKTAAAKKRQSILARYPQEVKDSVEVDGDVLSEEDGETVEEAINTAGMSDSARKMVADVEAAKAAKNKIKDANLKKTAAMLRSAGVDPEERLVKKEEVDLPRWAVEANLAEEEMMEGMGDKGHYEGPLDPPDYSRPSKTGTKKNVKATPYHNPNGPGALRVRSKEEEDAFDAKMKNKWRSEETETTEDELSETTSVDRLPPSARKLVADKQAADRAKNKAKHDDIRGYEKALKDGDKMKKPTNEEVAELEEDAPANNVGGGNIAGAGPGQVPPVKIKPKTKGKVADNEWDDHDPKSHRWAGHGVK